jgi:hypothetical protein
LKFDVWMCFYKSNESKKMQKNEKCANKVMGWYKICEVPWPLVQPPAPTQNFKNNQETSITLTTNPNDLKFWCVDVPL